MDSHVLPARGQQVWAGVRLPGAALVCVLAGCGTHAVATTTASSSQVVASCVTSETSPPVGIRYVDTRTEGPFWGPYTDRVKYYDSIEELQRSSTAVVVAHATDASHVESKVPGEYENIPFTVRTFTVTETLSGSLPSTSVTVRESGVETQRETTQAGRDYVLFLMPFGFEKGVQYDGEYVAVGGIAGQFALEGAYAVRIDPESTELPLAISLPFLRHRLGLC
jgi:hypothetical protein